MSENTKPRRFVFMFQSQFAELVTTGLKRQTVRAPRKRWPNVGDLIDCRVWTGAPYRSKQRHLCHGRITMACSCRITAFDVLIVPAPSNRGATWRELSSGNEDFAVADGFKDFASMVAWFAETHGLPFEGMLVKWEVVK